MLGKARNAKEADARRQALIEAFLALRTSTEMSAFLSDLCTPVELEDMADRWIVVGYLAQGLPYRVIQERTGVSTATITRVARSLVHGAGGYELLLNRKRARTIRKVAAQKNAQIREEKSS